MEMLLIVALLASNVWLIRKALTKPVRRRKRRDDYRKHTRTTRSQNPGG